MLTISEPKLSPRDLSTLSRLKYHQLCLVEIKITRFSPMLGKRLESISFPQNTRLICVIRNQCPIIETRSLFLEEHDIVYLMTNNETAIRELFTILHE